MRNNFSNSLKTAVKSVGGKRNFRKFTREKKPYENYKSSEEEECEDELSEIEPELKKRKRGDEDEDDDEDKSGGGVSTSSKFGERSTDHL